MECRKCGSETYSGQCPICDKQAYLEALGLKGRVLECACGWKFAGFNAIEEFNRHISRCVATPSGREYLARKQIGTLQRLFLTPRRLQELEDEYVRRLTREWNERQGEKPKPT